MPHSNLLRRLVVVASLLVIVSRTLGQGGEVELSAPQRFELVQPAFEKILGGPPAKLTDPQKVDIQNAVRGLVWPLTNYNRTGNKQTENGTMREMTTKCFDWIKKIYEYDESKNTDAKDQVTQTMITELRLILMNSQQKPIVRVNAARVLARLAAVSRKDATAELIGQVVADAGQIDGARYWAFRGLIDLTSDTERGQPAVVLTEPILEKAVVALVQFIERKPPRVTPKTPTEELDGLRMVRKEAIRALANLRTAGTGKPEGRAALTLARVMRKDKMLELEPRIDEQVEAAVGLAQLPADPKIGYQPGYSAYQIALFAEDLARAYDQSNKSPRFPWKTYAARIITGLQGMKQTHAQNALVEGLYDPAFQLLNGMEIGANLVPQPLRTWITTNQAAMPPAMYEKDAGAKVQPAGTGN